MENGDRYETSIDPHRDPAAINYGEQEWQNLQQTLQGAQQFAARGDKLISLKFDRTEIQVYGDVAVLYSLFTLETEEAGKRKKTSGRATEIFRHKGDTWVNTGWHLDSGA
jgi:ketosteroid isomerase-like protein